MYNDAYKTLRSKNVSKRNKLENDFGVKIIEFRNEILFNKSYLVYIIHLRTNLEKTSSMII
jgi:hypothetical protein